MFCTKYCPICIVYSNVLPETAGNIGIGIGIGIEIIDTKPLGISLD